MGNLQQITFYKIAPVARNQKQFFFKNTGFLTPLFK